MSASSGCLGTETRGVSGGSQGDLGAGALDGKAGSVRGQRQLISAHLPLREVRRNPNVVFQEQHILACIGGRV